MRRGIIRTPTIAQSCKIQHNEHDRGWPMSSFGPGVLIIVRAAFRYFRPVALAQMEFLRHPLAVRGIFMLADP